MSTYLLAFVVGELESIEDTADSGTLLRIWTTPGKSEQGRFALEAAKRLLAYYNDYFGIPYPLEKMDQLAIPDFAAGAMENWGAITYREVALLFDPENSSPRARQLIAEVVAHEMAHMWFGDLVTMDWWNDLWLNESFASWMATKAVDHLYPEWDLWTQFVSSDVNAGLGLDGLENSHPIEQEVKDPSEINQLFDAISYQKGASILRMLEQFLGPEQFRKGLRRYLSEHIYQNATGTDLWSAMQEETGQPVVAMMESWINQVGYPVLNVDVNRADAVSIGLTQQRFLYSGPNQDTTLWQIPVRASVQGVAEPVSMVMSDREDTLEAQPPQGVSNSWVKVNSQQTGFYRVQYKQEDLARLIPAVESLELPAADRLGLQADAYALARAGLAPATQFLDLARAYGQETEYPVWADLTANLRGMASLIAQEPYYEQYQEFGRGLLSGIARKVGWEKEAEEGHLQSLLRSTVLGQMGAFGDSPGAGRGATTVPPLPGRPGFAVARHAGRGVQPGGIRRRRQYVHVPGTPPLRGRPAGREGSPAHGPVQLPRRGTAAKNHRDDAIGKGAVTGQRNAGQFSGRQPQERQRDSLGVCQKELARAGQTVRGGWFRHDAAGADHGRFHHA